jgi:hypothetical protein
MMLFGKTYVRLAEQYSSRAIETSKTRGMGSVCKVVTIFYQITTQLQRMCSLSKHSSEGHAYIAVFGEEAITHYMVTVATICCVFFGVSFDRYVCKLVISY